MISAERPWPGASTRTTSWSVASAAASGPQQRRGLGEAVHQHERRALAVALGVQEHGVDPGRRCVLGCGRDGAPTRGPPGHVLRHARRRVGAVRRRARRGEPGLAVDAAGAGARRRRPHHGARAPRRAQRRLPGARPGRRHRRAGRRPDHERHGGRRAAPGGGRGRPGAGARCSSAPPTGRPSCIDVGAPQAIDQTHLYGRAVRWFHAPGVADEAAAPRWRSLAARAYAEAAGPAPGPVHLDLAFREPLVGTAGELPAGPGRPEARGPGARAATDVGGPGDQPGRRPGRPAGHLRRRRRLRARPSRSPGWPPPSAGRSSRRRRRRCGASPDVIRGHDALLRNDLDLQPEVIVHLGGPLASRVAGEWLAATGAAEIVAAGERAWLDPHGTAAVVLPIPPAPLLDAWLARGRPGRAGRRRGVARRAGRSSGRRAVDAIDARARRRRPGRPSRASPAPSSTRCRPAPGWSRRRRCRSATSSGTRPPAATLDVHANRGANGIDGVVSTAVGIALADRTRPTALLIGDVAFLHDSNGLLGRGAAGHRPRGRRRGQRRRRHLLVPPAGRRPSSRRSLRAALRHPPRPRPRRGGRRLRRRRAGRRPTSARPCGRRVAAGGVHVLVVRTDRAANVEVHRRLNAAVAGGRDEHRR